MLVCISTRTIVIMLVAILMFDSGDINGFSVSICDMLTNNEDLQRPVDGFWVLQNFAFYFKLLK